MTKKTKKVEWWLGELNRYGYCGNGDLKDGPHDSRKDVEQAAYLMQRLGFQGERKFVCIKMETSSIEPKPHKVDEELLDVCKETIDKYKSSTS